MGELGFLVLLGVGWLFTRITDDQSENSEGLDQSDAGYSYVHLGRGALGECFYQMDPSFLEKADRFMVESPGEWIVSPAPGATCRTTGRETSRHYAVGRLADAIDLMLISGDLETNYRFALERFGGVGVYPDWEPYPGLHLDGRPGGHTWAGIRDGRGQVYVPVSRVFA
jgi:hypothetical protein